MGFAQPCYPVGPVQICVFGDEGAGEGSPTSLMEKLCRLGLGVLSVQSKDGAALCEWLRMKFSAGFLQWEPSEASCGYEFNGQTRDVSNQNLEPRDALCLPNECSDEVWNKAVKRAQL